MRLLNAVALVLGSTGIARAEPAFIAGMGTASCGEYTLARARGGVDPIPQPVISYVSWVQGYLSGLNAARFDQASMHVEIPSPLTIMAFMDKHCRDAPLDTVLRAGMALESEIRVRE